MSGSRPEGPTAGQLSLQRRLRLVQTDQTAHDHHLRLHHMARRIQDLQRGGGGGGGGAAAKAAGRGGSGSAGRLRALRRSFEEGAAHGAPSDPWAARRQGGGAGGNGCPRTAPAGPAAARGLPREVDLAAWDGAEQQGSERAWAWAAGDAAEAAAAAAAAEAARRSEWEQLKQRRRYPELWPPVEPIQLPPSRYNDGGPPLLPSVQAQLYRRALLTDIIERRLYKRADLNALFAAAEAAAPPNHRETLRGVIAGIRDALRVPEG